MAITYVNDLRLSEMGTGDNSGTWGTVTNTNLELIGEALGFGTEAITTNADTHASTIADGSTDPVRAMYVKYTGTLDSACTITIGPNTVNKFYYIENATSGSQNIIISQGSGANVTIPAGDVKAVYLDGAGSGAAVVDAFASLNVVDLKVQDDLTVTDDMTVGGTLGVTGVLTANGGVIFNEDGEAAPDFRVESNDFDHMFFINGGLNNTAIGFNALPENQGAGLGILTGSGDGGVHLFREDGSFPSADESLGSFGWSGADSSGSLSTADAKITAFANENMAAGDAGTNIQFFIKADGVNQGTAPTRAMVIASTGQVRFEDGSASVPSISNSGDTNTGMYFPAADTIGFSEGGSEAMRIDSSGNLLVGHTSQDTPVDNGGAGVTLRPQGVMLIGGTGTSIYANREDSDGEIVQFRKDGSAVGSIATQGSRLSIGSGDTNLNFNASANSMYPISDATAGTLSDGAIDLGAATAQFKDLYLGGTATLTNSSSISGKTASASSLGLASGHTGSSLVLYIGQFGVSANSAISIDTNRIVTMPAQPAFSVNKGGTAQNNLAVGADVTITFDTERFDNNADFNLGANSFTAPVTGKYQFSLTIRLENVDSAAAYYIPMIITSNQSYRFIFDPDFGQDAVYWNVTISVLADMDASDTAHISFNQGAGTAQTDVSGDDAYTFFTGYLVC